MSNQNKILSLRKMPRVGAAANEAVGANLATGNKLFMIKKD
jgi:hypothetical protein